MDSMIVASSVEMVAQQMCFESVVRRDILSVVPKELSVEERADHFYSIELKFFLF